MRENSFENVYEHFFCENCALVVLCKEVLRLLILTSYAGCPLMSSMSSLVRESIAYPYMDFQKFADIHDFWVSVFNDPCKCGCPH